MPTHALDAVIDRAIAATRSQTPREIWRELEKIASVESPPSPVIGFVPTQGLTFKGATWERSGGTQPDVFTFNALRGLLWRRSK